MLEKDTYTPDSALKVLSCQIQDTKLPYVWGLSISH